MRRVKHVPRTLAEQTYPGCRPTSGDIDKGAGVKRPNPDRFTTEACTCKRLSNGYPIAKTGARDGGGRLVATTPGPPVSGLTASQNRLATGGKLRCGLLPAGTTGAMSCPAPA